jgi:uncharacterized membrane protein YecN with MAPEG domain
MQIPGITIAVTALFCVMMVLLSIAVSARRAKLSVTHGDAGDETLRRRIRAHGNFVEYAPLAVVMLGLLEISGVARQVLLVVGGACVLARVLHATGMLFTSGAALRGAGMLLQHASFIGGAYFLARILLG